MSMICKIQYAVKCGQNLHAIIAIWPGRNLPTVVSFCPRATRMLCGQIMPMWANNAHWKKSIICMWANYAHRANLGKVCPQSWVYYAHLVWTNITQPAKILQSSQLSNYITQTDHYFIGLVPCLVIRPS